MSAKDFLFSLPSKVPVEALDGIQTNFHFNLSGESGGQYTVNINDNKVDVQEGLLGDPSCVVSCSAEDFSRILSGDLNPMMAVFTGKIKISNQSEMLKYAKLFGMR